MPREAPERGLVSVERLAVVHRLPRGTVGATPARYERLFRERFAHCATALVAARFGADRLVFIRRLVLDLVLNAAWDDGRISAEISSAARFAFARLDHADRGDVVIFAHRAAYLAHYLATVTSTGRAGAWYFSSFKGLHALPVSMKVRTTACAEPAEWLAAMRELGDGECERVLSCLTDADARRILQAYVSDPPRRLDEGEAHAIWSALARNGSHAPTAWGARPSSLAPAALYRFMRLIRAVPDAPPEAVGPLALTLTVLEQTHARMPGDGLVRALRSADRRWLRAHLDDTVFRRAPWLLESPHVDSVCRWLQRQDQAADERDASRFGDERFTVHGGLFLLLPFFAEGIGAWFDRVAGIGNCAPLPLIRIAVAGCCLGVRGRGVWNDPLWRDLFGVTSDVTERSLMQWLGATPPVHPAGERDSSDLETKHAAGDRVWCGSALGDMADTPLSRAVVSTARGVIRRFAGRLRGFHESSVPHLFRNFLDDRACVQAHERSLDVSLARPPLHLVLSMSGLMNRPHVIPWLDERPVVVSFQRER